jgi:CBS-domain-containing membrane protein
MTERAAIEDALELLGSNRIEAAAEELRAALRRHDEQLALRRERDRMLLDYCERYGMTAREARALLAVERPDLKWVQK